MKKWLTFSLLMVLAGALMFCGAQAEDIPQDNGQTGTQTENGEGDTSAVVEDYSFTLTASSLTYGMHLEDSAIQAAGSTITLNGETVPAESLGTFLWRERSQVPAVGTWHCSAFFSPYTDLGVSFEDVTVEVTVNKARPEITVKPTASPLVYGQSLSQSTLSGGVAMNAFNSAMDPVQGVFEWELRDMVPSVGMQEATVVFTPIINAADLYEPVYFSVQVEVEKLPVTLTEYPVPARALRYGEALSDLPLTGGRAEDESGQAVPGTFAFADGDLVPQTGTCTAEAVFTPADYAHRKEVRFSVQLTVEKAALTVSAEPVSITYGQALSEGQLHGTALDAQGKEVSGTWAFADGSVVPSVAQSGEYDVLFTPDNVQNYAPADGKVQVNVHKADLTLVWGENGKYMGEKDGAFHYSVPGMPEGMSLLGTPVRDAGEEVGEYVLRAEALSLPEELDGNYLLIKEDGVFTIRQYETSARASLSGEGEENGWYAEGAVLTAPSGFDVALSRGGTYAGELSLPESADGTDYYLQVTAEEHAGAVAGPFHADYKLDMTAPEIDVEWLDGNEFTLVARDAVSGVDRIYGIFAGPSESYGGAGEAFYAYAARETGNYTYVVHDAAGHTAAVTLNFPDTDGDGLTDAYEERTGTSVLLADTDGDGISDFDARRIRNMLEYEWLDVSASVMLGALTDGGVNAVVLPDENAGRLIRDENCALRQDVRTGQGLMRVNESGTYGMTGDILWFESDDGAYSAMHIEGVSGKAALSCNAPGGVIALCDFDDKALSDIRIADLRTGTVLVALDTAGATRFDLSPEARYLAYAKDGWVTVISLETGEVTYALEMDAGCVFRFDMDGRLVTENGVLYPEDGTWHLENAQSDMLVCPLAQVRRGESVLWIGNEEEGYAVRAAGSAVRSDGGMDVTLRGACVKTEDGTGFAAARDTVMALALSDDVSRRIESLDMTE